mmetsp:Transcript_26238/g.75684  ORF Transcript_26238/g.75684 Transcript_26238/m.75684 type:complete len:792 (+) Transcript_26238:100-2475(+)
MLFFGPCQSPKPAEQKASQGQHPDGQQEPMDEAELCIGENCAICPKKLQHAVMRVLKQSEFSEVLGMLDKNLRAEISDKEKATYDSIRKQGEYLRSLITTENSKAVATVKAEFDQKDQALKQDCRRFIRDGISEQLYRLRPQQHQASGPLAQIAATTRSDAIEPNPLTKESCVEEVMERVMKRVDKNLEGKLDDFRKKVSQEIAANQQRWVGCQARCETLMTACKDQIKFMQQEEIAAKLSDVFEKKEVSCRRNDIVEDQIAKMGEDIRQLQLKLGAHVERSAKTVQAKAISEQHMRQIADGVDSEISEMRAEFEGKIESLRQELTDYHGQSISGLTSLSKARHDLESRMKDMGEKHDEIREGLEKKATVEGVTKALDAKLEELKSHSIKTKRDLDGFRSELAASSMKGNQLKTRMDGTDKLLRELQANEMNLMAEAKTTLEKALGAVRADMDDQIGAVRQEMDACKSDSASGLAELRKICDETQTRMGSVDGEIEKAKRDLAEEVTSSCTQFVEHIESKLAANDSQALRTEIANKMDELTGKCEKQHQRLDKWMPWVIRSKDEVQYLESRVTDWEAKIKALSLQEPERRADSSEKELDLAVHAEASPPGESPAEGEPMSPPSQPAAEPEPSSGSGTPPTTSKAEDSPTQSPTPPAPTSGGAGAATSGEAPASADAAAASSDASAGRAETADVPGTGTAPGASRPSSGTVDAGVSFVHPEDPAVSAITKDIEKDLMKKLGASASEKKSLIKSQFLKCHPDKGPNDSAAMIWYQDWLKENKTWFINFAPRAA